jgi:hypothetical protein
MQEDCSGCRRRLPDNEEMHSEGNERQEQVAVQFETDQDVAWGPPLGYVVDVVAGFGRANETAEVTASN